MPRRPTRNPETFIHRERATANLVTRRFTPLAPPLPNMSFFSAPIDKMEFQDAQKLVERSMRDITNTFQKVPGSAMLIRYIQSSYQDDPVRSAIELILVIFFVRYLLAPSYATHNNNFVTLSEEVSTHASGEGKWQIDRGVGD